MTIKNIFLLVTVASVATIFCIVADRNKGWLIALLSLVFLGMVIKRFKKS